MAPLYDLNSPPSPFPLEVNDYSSHDHVGSSDHQRESSSSSVLQSAAVGYESASDRDRNGSSLKWMSSKMRIMKRMMNSNCTTSPPPLQDETNCFSKSTNNAIRVCSDCNTTTTPLWRGGPRGPKSLCNACGIRQRKARRALEAAANGGAVVKEKDATTTSMKIKLQYSKKEIKKSRTVHVGQYKKQMKTNISGNTCLSNQIQRQKKLCFKELALSLSKSSANLQRVFPQDVEDAAILLMELSCGPFHT